MKRRSAKNIISAVIIMTSVISCSTEKAGFFNTAYHNTTAHYNVWWNGNESLKEGVKILKKDVKDDYTQMLSVYKLGTNQEAVKIAPQLDRALEKGTKGITKHSININGKEHVHYISECYILIVKAQFYKQEYSTAAFTSQYLISQFKNTKQAYEGMIWYARSMTRMKEFISAETMLDKVNADFESGKAPSNLGKLIYPAYAECALAQEKYKVAVDYLKLSIDEVHDKKFKSRLYYILGQIYQNQEKLNTAFKYFELAAKGNSDYQMQFNARINMALSLTSKGEKNEAVVKTLQYMLKDKKNEEYRDQIYYVLGEVYMTSKDVVKAADNLEKSVANSADNPPQKIKSALRLGDVYADAFQNYVKAYAYYDTVVSVIKEEDKNYNQIKNRHTLLKSLAENIQIVNRADSLLAWADMSKEERDEKINKIIQRLKIEEEKAKEEEFKQMLRTSVKEQRNSLKGNWYFYNESTVSRGKESFIKLWGFRPLEDNWFMTNRQSIALNFMTHTEPVEEELELDEDERTQKNVKDSTIAVNVNDKYSPGFYLKDVPKTQAERDTLHDQIAKSLLILGFIFNEGIDNQEKAIESFVRLAEEYQGTEYALPAFYQLYLLFEKQGNTPNANYYRTLILKGFPDSDYANLLRDKNYYKEMLAREKAAGKKYSNVYHKFLNGEYDEVISFSKAAREMYADSDLDPKFLYWEAFAFGRKGHKDTMIHILESIVSTYPNNEIIPLIKSQLELFKKGGYDPGSGGGLTVNAPKTGQTSKDTAETVQGKDAVRPSEEKENVLSPESELYRFRENIPHYVVIILNDQKINGMQLFYKISDFNTKYFSTANLKASILLFSQNLEMINVERFPNAGKAMEYYTFIQRGEGPLEDINKGDFQVFAVSVQNYMTFYSQKNIAAYEKFFKKFYF